MTREEADREKLAINICDRYAILEEIRPVIETLAYSNKYRKLLDEICLDKKKLDKEIKDEQKEAIKRVKGEALIEKEDPGAFIFPISLEGKINLNGLADTGSEVNVMPYRIYMDLGREKVKKVNRGIEMINHSLAEPMGLLKDVLYQIGVTTIIAKFLILDIPIDIDAQIMVGRGFLSTCGGQRASDDEEEYAVKRDKFGAPTYGLKFAKYLNITEPKDRSLALQAALKPFHQICVWKKAVSFLGSLPLPLQHVDWKPEYNGYHKNKEKGTGKWKAEIRLTDPYGNIYNQGFTTKKTSRKWLNTTS
ncbi:agenet domain-containing protein [Tanacetum coccineum]